MTVTDVVIDDRPSIREIAKNVWPKIAGTLRFIAGRLAFAVVTLLIIIFLAFFGLDMARGAGMADAAEHGVRSSVAYLGVLAGGDLGTAFAADFGNRRLAITDIIKQTVPASLGLLSVSLIIATIAGIFLGFLAARQKSSVRALPIIIVSLIGISLPSFFTALLLQMAAIAWTRRMGSPLLPVGGFGWDAHIILPAIVLAVRPIAQITRVTNVTLKKIIGEDFVRTARSKGLGGPHTWMRHIWPNSAIAVLTTIGVSLRFSLSSLPVVEIFFGWPGIGLVLVRAIARRDDMLTVALALVFGLIVIAVNFILEASYRLIDPQLREKKSDVHGQSDGFIAGLKNGLGDLSEAIRDLPFLRRWLSHTLETDRLYEERLRNSLAQRPKQGEIDRHIRRERSKTWLRATLGNMPLMIGGVMIIFLGVLYVAGPGLSPTNPYNTKGIAKIDDVITVPPFAPSEEYAWGSDALGRDMQSLVFSGAQQTLTLIFWTMVARMMVGFVLGTLAGFRKDSPLDKFIMASAEVFSSLPMLIFAMLLILALGIRQGMWVFVVALTFVGWTESMQFIRSEVIVQRNKLYVESARASGSRMGGIIWRHFLPNLLPAMISLAALEMAAIAMILGELGFIGIFIGGGSFSDILIGGPPYHYSDVPEWGALLSNVRVFARGYPWTAIYPAMAFFVAILGFNLFGEGLRYLVQDVGLSFNRLFNRYSVVAVIVAIWAFGWIQSNTGSMVFYKQRAKTMSQTQMMDTTAFLAAPNMDGRAIGTAGNELTADYIGQKFQEYGLQPAGLKGTYFFDVKRDYFSLTETPQLIVNGEAYRYREDFAEIPTGLFNASEPKSGELVVLGFGDQVFANSSFTGQTFPPEITDLDLSQNAVLILEPAGALPNITRQGTFFLTNDQSNITRRDSLSAFSPDRRGGGPLAGGPFFFVNETAANRMLASAGLNVADLLKEQDRLGPEEVKLWPTGVTVESAMLGERYSKEPARHVIGYWPGVDTDEDSNLIVVLAQYDGLGYDENGVLYPGANDNASSISVMLETLRTWHETGYEPRKTIIFVAYVGEGIDYGQSPSNTVDVGKFLSAKFGFATAFTPEAFVFLRGLGAGSGDGLLLQAGGNIRLAQLFETAGDEMGVKTKRANEQFLLDVIFGGSNAVATEDAPTIEINWEGYEETAGTPGDTVQAIDPKKLKQAGDVLSLALQIMARELDY